MSCVAFWFAFEVPSSISRSSEWQSDRIISHLQDATRDNGCLWVIPRSHKEGIKRRFVREGEGVTFKPPKGSEPDWDLSAFVPVEVPAGKDFSLSLSFSSFLVLPHLTCCVHGLTQAPWC